jgi:cell division protein FtsI (penicillin-binding protein 3)
LYQASFAGYFPADQPKYTMVVVLYSEPTKSSGVFGGAWAAPVFKEIADKIYADRPEWAEQLNPSDASMMAHLITQNANRPAPAKITDNLIPSVVGMVLQDALFLLENQGLKVSFSGAGKIMSQTLAPGTKVVKGTQIHLELR